MRINTDAPWFVANLKITPQPWNPNSPIRDQVLNEILQEWTEKPSKHTDEQHSIQKAKNKAPKYL